MFLVVLVLQAEEPEKDTTPQADAGSVQQKGAKYDAYVYINHHPVFLKFLCVVTNGLLPDSFS